jgi:hypothetical protein
MVMLGAAAWDELRQASDPSRPGDASQALRIGGHGSMALGGGLLAASGSAKVAEALGYAGKLERLSRWGGRLGVAATALGGVALGSALLWQYQSGYLTDRQMARISISTAGGMLAGAGGAWGGAMLGAALGTMIAGLPGTALGGTVGGVLGGLAGGWTGHTLASTGVESYFEMHDGKMEEKRINAVYAFYGVKN